MKHSWVARPARLRIIITTSAIALASSLAALATQATSVQAAPVQAASTATLRSTAGTKPVIVLVHGAWADASSWDGVISDLTSAGFTVYAPPDPLRGLSSDAAYLNDFLTMNPALAGKPVVLVGHSYAAP